jgi:formate-dependent nitrite reductase cytochrome c552 subunit
LQTGKRHLIKGCEIRATLLGERIVKAAADLGAAEDHAALKDRVTKEARARLEQRRAELESARKEVQKAQQFHDLSQAAHEQAVDMCREFSRALAQAARDKEDTLAFLHKVKTWDEVTI